ncbi:MAG: MATE family efflux transporter [Clostridiales bacterium]|nr:MATE family efflux transporter [Clostridiales bacterium]
MANRMGTDLTEGSIVKHLITFSVPLLLGNVFQALYNTVDSIWVGQFLGPEALGAVSVSFPITFILISLVTGITMATSVLVAQYAGAKDPEMITKTMNNSLLLLGTVAVIVTSLGIAFSKQILILLNTPQDVLSFAVEYLNIYLLGLVFVFGFNVMSAVLNGLGDPRTPVKFLIIATITNIILDPFFIFGIGFFPKMGIAGAALATIISQALALTLIMRHLYKINHIISPRIRDFKFVGELIWKLIKIGLPAGIQQIVVSMGLTIMVGIINSFGSSAVAAFGAASRLDQFAHMPAMSFGLAVSAITGQSLGAKKPERVKDVFKWGSILVSGITFIMVILALTVPKAFLKIFTSDADVLSIGSGYLRIVGLSYIPFSLMFVSNGILRGAGDTFPTMVFSFVSLWLIRIPLARYLSSIESLGVNGIWIAISSSSIISMALSQTYYKIGWWKNKKLVVRKAQSAEPRPDDSVEVIDKRHPS